MTDQYSLDKAHDNKARKYQHLTNEIKKLTGDETVNYTSLTLSWRGIRSAKSLRQMQMNVITILQLFTLREY